MRVTRSHLEKNLADFSCEINKVYNWNMKKCFPSTFNFEVNSYTAKNALLQLSRTLPVVKLADV